MHSSTSTSAGLRPGNLALAVARSILGTADAALDQATVEAARVRLMHAVGVAVTGTQFDPFHVALSAVAGENGTSTVFARSRQLSAGGAAFVNAIAAHSCLQEDCGPGGLREGSHPGTYIVPAALAAAEIAGCSGETLMRGLIAGYEAVGLLGVMAPPGLSARRFRPVGVMGPFGSAAAAAYILGADADALAVALAIAGNSAGGSSQGFVSGSIEPYLHAGLAARNGLLAGQLATAGASASPEALEGDHGFFAVYAGEAPGTVPAPGDDAPAITRLGSKKYAVCLQNQETLELAGELVPEIDAAGIDRVVLRRPSTSANGTGSPGVGAAGPFDTMLQRQMSARFSAAAALLGRNTRDPEYFDRAADDTAVADLAARIELEPTERDEIELQVVLDGGRSIAIAGRRADILFPTGDSVRRLFSERIAHVLGAGAAAEAAPLFERLPELPDASVLVRSVALRA